MSFRELLESGANVNVTIKLDDLRAILKEATGRAIQCQPDLITAYHYRGIARFYMKDYDGALRRFPEAEE